MNAFANIRGGSILSCLKGYISFWDVLGGTEVFIEVWGLPLYKPASNNNPPIGPHGFHIHEFGMCENEFKSAGKHWAPDGQPHGNHAGDFPVIFSNNGYARMAFFTNRFKPQEVVGKSIIIHENPDDYRTQPNGAAGRRIGCGVILPI